MTESKKTPSPQPEKQDPAHKLIKGYEEMLSRVKASMHELRSKHEPKLQQHIGHAKQKAIELGELSEHEAEKIASYLQRDIEDAAQFMSAANQRFQDWLALDWQAIEVKLFEMCRQVADQSVIEWQRLRQHLPLRDSTYMCGEVTGIGSLKCKNCEQVMNFVKTSRIPPCPKCQMTEFRRVDPDIDAE